MNNKGVSIMSLVITMIVIIILAGIAMNAGTTNIDKAQKSAFLSDLERAQFELQ
jgi:Tfp pilus assembly protein PilE